MAKLTSLFFSDQKLERNQGLPGYGFHIKSSKVKED